MKQVKKHDFLFLMGCPRSGTTALWSLLTSDSRIRLGVERYGLRALSPGFIDPSLFEFERFFALKEGDTFYPNLERFNPYYEVAKEGWDGALYRGDKIPKLYRVLPILEKNFPGARMIGIVRGIEAVASSYKARQQDFNDDWSLNVRDAVRDWNESLEVFLSKGDQENFLVIRYEDLFIQGGGLRQIFEFLGLDPEPKVYEEYRKLLRRGGELSQNRVSRLTSDEERYIALNADMNSYQSLEHRIAGQTEAADTTLKLSRPSQSALGRAEPEWICIVCGRRHSPHQAKLFVSFDEKCTFCHASPRVRAVVLGVIVGLRIPVTPIPDWKEDWSRFGLGFGDSPWLAWRLASRIKFVNSHLDQFPAVDLREIQPELLGSFEFAVCSEVLEHVLPDVELAVDGLFSLIRPGGFAVVSVPLNRTVPVGKIDEYYPDLVEYHGQSDGTVRLVQRDGSEYLEKNPDWHGGAGKTLALRSFGPGSLGLLLESRGFEVARLPQEYLGLGVSKLERKEVVVARRAP